MTFACADPGRLAEFWGPRVARFEALGARVKERKTETLGPFRSSFVVMADPEGNGFCVQAAR